MSSGLAGFQLADVLLRSVEGLFGARHLCFGLWVFEVELLLYQSMRDGIKPDASTEHVLGKLDICRVL